MDITIAVIIAVTLSITCSLGSCNREQGNFTPLKHYINIIRLGRILHAQATNGYVKMFNMALTIVSASANILRRKMPWVFHRLSWDTSLRVSEWHPKNSMFM